jgi:hypothetical protein
MTRGSPHEAQDGVRSRIGLVSQAAERPVGDVEQQHAEHVDDPFDGLDEREPAHDRHATEHEGATDADDDDRVAGLRGHCEVREQEREEKDVVKRQRALDQVHGRPLACRPTRQRDPRRDRGGEQNPADAPRDRFASARLPARREQEELHDEADDDADRRGEREG